MKPLKDFEIKREQKEGVQILRLAGVLDDYSFHRLQGALQNLHRAGQARVVVNCEDVDYMSSGAIRSLVDFAKQAREDKGDLLLVKVSDNIKGIMDVLGFTKEFKLFQQDKEAIEQLKSPGSSSPETKT